MNGCVIVELSRWSIACWYRIGESDPEPLSFGEGHALPLYFRVDDSGVHMGESARQLFLKGERERAFGDYFRMARAGTTVRIFGNEVPAKALLFDAVEKYMEVFLRDHAKIREQLAAHRKTIPLRFAFAMDLDVDERFLVLSVFKSGGYGDVEALDVPGTLRQTILNEKKPPTGTAMVWLAALEDDVFMSYLPPGQGASTDPLKLGVSGADPRLNSLVEMLFLEATESTRMALNKEVETPVLEEAAKAMLIKGGARFSATITLADGDTTFDAAISAAEVEEKAKWNTAAQQILTGVDQLLSKLSRDKAQVICLLSGAGITTPYFERRVQDAFKQVISLSGPLAAAWRKEMFAGIGPKKPIGFPQPSTPPPPPVTVPPPPPPPPPPTDPYDVNAEIARRKAEEERKNTELEKKYAFETGLGDHDFESGNWDAALGRYKAASALKPHEPYPLERARLCLEKIAKLASESKERFEKYQGAIKQGDLAVKAWDFSAARRQYEVAKTAMPGEPYPVNQLAEVKRWEEKVALGPDKWVTALLALFLGGIGVHRFYLGQIGRGILAMLFFWTGLPAVVGFFKGLNFLFMGVPKFNRAINRGIPRKNTGMLVMLGMLVALGAGVWYLNTQVLQPGIEKLTLERWSRLGIDQRWMVVDDRGGKDPLYELTFEPPTVGWSILSYGEGRTVMAFNARSLSNEAPELPRMVCAHPTPIFENRYTNSAVNFCAEGGNGPCATVAFIDREGLTFTFKDASGGSRTLRAVPAESFQQATAEQDYQENGFLREVDALTTDGGVVRLGVFKAYVCQGGVCAAAFEEETANGTFWREFTAQATAYGTTRLARTSSTADGDRTNRSLVGRKFLFGTRIMTVSDPSTGQQQQAHVLTALIPYKERMNVPALRERLRRAAQADAQLAPEQAGGQEDFSEDTSSVSTDTEQSIHAGSGESVFDLAAVQEQPEFPGGMEKMYQYFAERQKYPNADYEAGNEGKVYVQFTVAEDGAIKDAKVIRSASPGLDAEALRIVNAMPNWKPAIMDGKLVKCRFNLPVIFKLK